MNYSLRSFTKVANKGQRALQDLLGTTSGKRPTELIRATSFPLNNGVVLVQTVHRLYEKWLRLQTNLPSDEEVDPKRWTESWNSVRSARRAGALSPVPENTSLKDNQNKRELMSLIGANSPPSVAILSPVSSPLPSSSSFSSVPASHSSATTVSSRTALSGHLSKDTKSLAALPRDSDRATRRPVTSSEMTLSLEKMCPQLAAAENLDLVKEFNIFITCLKQHQQSLKTRFETIVLSLSKIADHALGQTVNIRFHESCDTGLFLPLPYSDVDLSLKFVHHKSAKWNNAKSAASVLETLYKALSKSIANNKEIGELETLLPKLQVQFVPNAKIPIVKLFSPDDGLSIDIGFNVPNINASSMLATGYTSLFPMFVPLTLVVKLFLKTNGLNCTADGSVGSFLVQDLVICFLQVGLH